MFEGFKRLLRRVKVRKHSIVVIVMVFFAYSGVITLSVSFENESIPLLVSGIVLWTIAYLVIPWVLVVIPKHWLE